MPRRRSFFRRIKSRIQRRFFPKERRRGSRDFKDREPATPINPDLPQFGAGLPSFGARQPFGPQYQRPSEEDMRDIFNEEGGSGDYENARRFFDSLGTVYESSEEEEEVWGSFVRNMLSGARRRDDRDNPFWSDLGITMRHFNWDGFRALMNSRGS